MVAALFEVQNYFFLVKFLCFLLISEMFNEPYLLHFHDYMFMMNIVDVQYLYVSYSIYYVLWMGYPIIT